MLSRLFRFFFPRPQRYHFVVRPAANRPSGLTIRPYTPGDLAACVQLYKENEPGRFPPDHADTYAASLEKQHALVLIAERAGEVVGAAGIHSGSAGAVFYYWLTYGLVSARQHGQGIGTALLLARVALLPEPAEVWPLLLTTVVKSRSFYERFGFNRFAFDSHHGAPVVGSFVAHVGPRQIGQARKYLRTLGVCLHEGSFQIPYQSGAEESGAVGN